MLFQFYANVDGALPPVETFSYVGNDVINAPVTNPVFGAYNYADCNGDTYAINVSGTGLVFNGITVISPSNGIVKLADSSRVFFFQADSGSGFVSRSDDGTAFVESSYTVDTADADVIAYVAMFGVGVAAIAMLSDGETADALEKGKRRHVGNPNG